VEYHLFGPTGLRVSELFLGAMIFGDTRVGATPEESHLMMDDYLEAGGNVIDTAVNYAGGASEGVVGDWLAGNPGKRDQVVLATKYTLATVPDDPNSSGNHRKNLQQALDLSLRRLHTDRIDIYWVHIWDERTPVQETMRALDDAVRAGKVLYVGISDAPAWVVSHANTLAEWRGWTPFAGIQVPYNLINRDIERDLLPMAEHFGLAVATWGALNSGVLSGKFTRGHPADGSTRVAAGRIGDRDLAIAQAVDEVADELDVSSAQVAIAWSRCYSDNVFPIIGARSREQLADNLAAAGVTLPEHALRRLENAASFTRGFPADFIRDTASFVYGNTGPQTRTRGPLRRERTS
jgi:aryl-alcohol dehydrogenase-like predicted oxidoreductase